MKIFRWIAGLAVTVIVVAFAVANRQALTVRFDPFPYELELPVYVIVLGALAAGFAAGMAVQWLLGQKWRYLARARQRRIGALEEEVEGLRRQRETGKEPSEDISLPLPPPGDAA